MSYFTNIQIKPKIKPPYLFSGDTDKDIGNHLKDLKKTREIIREYDINFTRVGLCSDERIEEVLRTIDEEIKLCEHYFKTKKRTDLNGWFLITNYKPHEWNKERDVWYYSNGIVKGVINIFRNEKSIKIESYLENDCDLFVNLYPLEYKDRIVKNLRNEESVKKYIKEMKEYLEKEVNKNRYNLREEEFNKMLLTGGRE